MADVMEDQIKDNPQSTMFSSLEEERAYHTRKAEQFKNRLTSQVDEFKMVYGEKAKTGAVIGGAVLGATILVRLLTGTKKKWVESDHGPVKIKKTESVLWSLAKGAALVGIAYLAKDPIMEYIEQNTQPDPDADAGNTPPYPAEPHTEL